MWHLVIDACQNVLPRGDHQGRRWWFGGRIDKHWAGLIRPMPMTIQKFFRLIAAECLARKKICIHRSLNLFGMQRLHHFLWIRLHFLKTQASHLHHHPFQMHRRQPQKKEKSKYTKGPVQFKNFALDFFKRTVSVSIVIQQRLFKSARRIWRGEIPWCTSLQKLLQKWILHILLIQGRNTTSPRLPSVYMTQRRKCCPLSNQKKCQILTLPHDCPMVFWMKHWNSPVTLQSPQTPPVPDLLLSVSLNQSQSRFRYNPVTPDCSSWHFRYIYIK